MRLRTQPQLFARVFVDAVTTRPLMRALLTQRRACSKASPDEALVAREPEFAARVPEVPRLPEAA